MIYPDLTVILEKYCEWDYIVRNKYLRYATALLKQNQKVFFNGQDYHNIEDLRVDLEDKCGELVHHD